MDLICPLCNSLVDYRVKCDDCGEYMVDSGRLTDYYDDYSPYLELSITDKVDGAPANQCVHLFTCKVCLEDKKISIDKIIK